MEIIDAHAHVYSYDTATYPTRENPLTPPNQAGTIEHLRRLAKEAGVSKVMGVQTSTFYGWDNRFIYDIVKANQDWMAGVCTLDPDDPASPSEMARFAKEANFRAIRLYSTPGHTPAFGFGGFRRGGRGGGGETKM